MRKKANCESCLAYLERPDRLVLISRDFTIDEDWTTRENLLWLLPLGPDLGEQTIYVRPASTTEYG